MQRKIDDMVVLGVGQEDLLNSIAGLEQLKPILQEQVKIANGKNIRQGIKDASELGKHFDTAITAMQMVLGAFPEYKADSEV